MAMEDPRVLLQYNMSFNPFRSSSHPSSPPPSSRPSHQHQQRINDTDNDSWHSNAPPYISIRHNSKNGNNPSSPHRSSSSALSWFSSWSTSTRTSSPSKRTSSTTSHVSSAIIIQDGDHRPTHHSASMPPPPAVSSSSHLPLSSQTSPAKSMTMNRGMASPEAKEMRQTHDNLHQKSSVPPLPLHNQLGAGGCMPIIPQNGSSRIMPSKRRSSSSRVEKSIEEGNEIKHLDHRDLPSYPEPKASPRKQTTRQALSQRTDSKLLEEFPMTKSHTETKAATIATIGNAKTTASQPSNQKRKQIVPKEEEFTFPGFTLYQTAKVHYCLGQYSQALYTTTECLEFQKLSLHGSEGSAPAALPTKGIASPNADTNSTTSSSIGKVNDNKDINASMTALDLRSYVVTGVGSSVRGVVQSLKESRQIPLHQHPMLSNSIAIMVSQYPSHPGVAQTLLLRGHILAACGLYGYDGDDDFSFLLQEAIRHVEMAVAIQRKLAIVGEELAAPLIFLGNLKTRLGQFDEADMTYKEAVSILRNVQSNAKNNQVDAAKTENAKVSSDCAQYLKRITSEIAHALYLHGKSYHCQRMHAQAFVCYNKALNLLKKSGAMQDSFGVKRIVRCMKNRYALEKLVSTYWDDAGAI
mmetsp:Transcript_24352/g.52513  ORF Transcript_24352/g.52513 Transcript_24352/m.52513 type:complete len:636 (+) Transcript_24352:330-2237(+)